MEHLMRGKSCLLLILAIQFHLAYAFALLPLSVHRRTPAKLHNSSPLSCNDARSRCTSSLNVQKQRCLSLSSTTVEEECDNITVDTYAAAAKTTKRHDLHNSNSRHLMSYALHWDNLLQREYQESVLESQRRRKSYTKSQLEASGLVIFNAVATPESELFGEKIVRVTIFDATSRRTLASGGNQQTNSQTSKRYKLRDKFKRGDVLMLTPQISFRGKDDLPPREGLVMDVGNDYLTLGVGSTWPLGLIEMRKNVDSYRVRLDRSVSGVPLRAQRMALEKLRKGKAGYVATLLVQLQYEQHTSLVLDTAREMPCHFDHCQISNDLEQQIKSSMKETVQSYRTKYSFWPNTSQREAIIWALKRRMALIRGPPGTGKTRTAALLIATAMRMKLKHEHDVDEGYDINAAVQNDDATTATPRILAVTHSNGAADVLLEALLQMNVPAVRAGRPASVSPSVQHRTIAALSERMPEVVSLRKQARNITLDERTRNAAAYDAQRYVNDVQNMIAKTAPVVVASCIGAQQLLSCLEDEDDAVSAFQIVVLDEAAQTTEPALVCALAAAKARQVILVGDPMQLPPTVTTQDAELRKTIGVSPMESLLKNGVEEFVLNEQYRMPYSLLYHPNKYFYDSVVKCSSTAIAPPPKGFPWPSPNAEPLAYIEIGDGANEVAHTFGGRSNPVEVEVIIDIVQKFIAAGDIKPKDIAIITPYNKQAQLFRTKLNNSGSTVHGQEIYNVQVGTVDSFQGQETELVIFSAVRSNQLKELGFLRDARRLNVAITRARRGLIVVGDPTVLRTCRHWSALLESCSDRRCVLTEVEYNNLRIEGTVDVDRTLASSEVDMKDELYGLFTY
jgi:DNA polymerase III delta prime subunit